MLLLWLVFPAIALTLVIFPMATCRHAVLGVSISVINYNCTSTNAEVIVNNRSDLCEFSSPFAFGVLHWSWRRRWSNTARIMR
jgi:hypothetical protein